MNVIHPCMEVWAAFRTREPAPELPELRGLAFIDHNVRKYHADAQSEIRVRLHEAGPERVIGVLRNAGVRLSRFVLTPRYLPEFWNAPPEDCVGALLAEDGHMALRDAGLYWRVVPLSEPLNTSGRPEGDGEHSRHKPHVIRAGGIPIVSNALLETLRQLGAEGDTGEIIYCGKKAAHGTVQQGFQRFLPRPEYEMPSPGGIEFLPESVPVEFGVCGLLRNRKGATGIPENAMGDEWYDIALPIRLCEELRRLRTDVLLTPIFHIGGVTHRWVSELEAAVAELTV